MLQSARSLQPGVHFRHLTVSLAYPKESPGPTLESEGAKASPFAEGPQDKVPVQGLGPLQDNHLVRTVLGVGPLPASARRVGTDPRVAAAQRALTSLPNAGSAHRQRATPPPLRNEPLPRLAATAVITHGRWRLALRLGSQSAEGTHAAVVA